MWNIILEQPPPTPPAPFNVIFHIMKKSIIIKSQTLLYIFVYFGDGEKRLYRIQEMAWPSSDPDSGNVILPHFIEYFMLFLKTNFDYIYRFSTHPLILSLNRISYLIKLQEQSHLCMESYKTFLTSSFLPWNLVPRFLTFFGLCASKQNERNSLHVLAFAFICELMIERFFNKKNGFLKPVPGSYLLG